MLCPGIHTGTVSMLNRSISFPSLFGSSLNPIIRAIVGSTFALSRHCA